MNHEELVAQDDTRLYCNDIKGWRISTIKLAAPSGTLPWFETALYPTTNPNDVHTQLRTRVAAHARRQHMQVCEDTECDSPDLRFP